MKTFAEQAKTIQSKYKDAKKGTIDYNTMLDELQELANQQEIQKGLLDSSSKGEDNSFADGGFMDPGKKLTPEQLEKLRTYNSRAASTGIEFAEDYSGWEVFNRLFGNAKRYKEGELNLGKYGPDYITTEADGFESINKGANYYNVNDRGNVVPTNNNNFANNEDIVYKHLDYISDISKSPAYYEGSTNPKYRRPAEDKNFTEDSSLGNIDITEGTASIKYANGGTMFQDMVRDIPESDISPFSQYIDTNLDLDASALGSRDELQFGNEVLNNNKQTLQFGNSFMPISSITEFSNDGKKKASYIDQIKDYMANNPEQMYSAIGAATGAISNIINKNRVKNRQVKPSLATHNYTSDFVDPSGELANINDDQASAAYELSHSTGNFDSLTEGLSRLNQTAAKSRQNLLLNIDKLNQEENARRDNILNAFSLSNKDTRNKFAVFNTENALAADAIKRDYSAAAADNIMEGLRDASDIALAKKLSKQGYDLATIKAYLNNR